MKKILSLLLALTVILSTILTATMSITAAEAAPVKTTHIDLTQGATFCAATGGHAGTAAVKDGKLEIEITQPSTPPRQLWSKKAGGTWDDAIAADQDWFPNFPLMENGSTLLLTTGSKAIVEVTYKILEVTDSSNGVQVAVASHTADSGTAIYQLARKTHSGGDAGKEFTLSAVYTVDAKTRVRIAFSGKGKLEISSITVHELSAAHIDEYAVVRYIDGDSETTKFAEKDSEPEAPADKEGFTFGGWYESEDFTGTAVSEISGNMILYAGWAMKTTHIDLTQGATFCAATGGHAGTAAVKDGKLEIEITQPSTPPRQLWSKTAGGTWDNATPAAEDWFPNFPLMENGAALAPTTGSKVIVEVTYKLLEVTDTTNGVQIAVASHTNNSGTSVYQLARKNHSRGDAGKEFTLSAVYTVDAKNRVRIAFSGKGKLEISSITVYELFAAHSNEYAAVRYIDGDSETTKFVEKNSETDTPADKEGYLFDGWFESEDFTGTAVSEISGNMMLHAKWTADLVVVTTPIDLTQGATFCDATGGHAGTAAVKDGKLEIEITQPSTPPRQLWSKKAGGTWDDAIAAAEDWFPNFPLMANGSVLALTTGNKAIVEVTYKILEVTDTTNGVQIAVASHTNNSGSSIYQLARKNHSRGDAGKEFTLSAVYTVDAKNRIRIAFSGKGKLEISSITVHELFAAHGSEYVVAKYVDGDGGTTKFVEPGSAVETPAEKEGFTFGGWFESEDFTGEAVSEISGNTLLYAKWIADVPPVVTTHIDLTQDPDNAFFKQLGGNDKADGTVKDGKLEVNVYNYDRFLEGTTPSSALTWFPNYLLCADGSPLHLTNRNKAIVEVTYKVTAVTDMAHGTQIGIGTFDGGKGNNIYTKVYQKHMSEDVGKEFVLSAVYDVDSKYAVKIAFAGGGKLEISSITVHELSAEYFDQYAVVKYVNRDKETYEFAEIGSEPRTPVRLHFDFGGWYTDEAFTGERVTEISENVTLYAKWNLQDGCVVIEFHDSTGNGTTVENYAIGDPVEVTPVKAGYRFLGWYKYANYVGRPVTTATGDLTDLYAKWEETDPDIWTTVDVTKNTTVITTSKTPDCKAALSGTKIVFDIHNYERQLDKTDTTNADSWFPSYYFKDSSENDVTLNIGETYELEVTYKVLSVTAGDTVGLQIGFGADGQKNNRTRIKGYSVHKKADEGKTFTYKTSYTAEKFNFGAVHLPKLLFSGQGSLEVSSIRIKRILPVIKDTVFGTQDYENYGVGSSTGVLGDAKGTDVSREANHTSGLLKSKALKLSLDTAFSRMSGNTIISLTQDGELKPLAVQKGAAYAVTFYLYANSDMDDLVWSINSVGDTVYRNYLTNFQMEIRDTVSLKKGEWKQITAYIPVLKGCSAPKNLLSISVASAAYTGQYVYIDDVEIRQLVDSEVIVYNTAGGAKLEPQRAFAGQKFLSFREPTRNGYLFDGWYYDAEYTTEAKLGDTFPTDRSEIVLYAKWIAAPGTAEDFNAGSFDASLYENGVSPYENSVEDMDSTIYFENNKTMTQSVAWVKDAGIYGNGTSETDGAISLSNDLFSWYNDKNTYNAVRLLNADGTPFIAVKGARYTIEFDYIFAASKGVSYIIPIISEKSAYTGLGSGAAVQTLDKVSVMDTDTDYQTYKQSFIAERTGYVYFTLTGRDDNANVDVHCYEKVYIDNVHIRINNNVTKLVINEGSNTRYTKYGVKGEKLVLANALYDGSDTFDGFYLDAAFQNKFDGNFPAEDTTIYIKLKKDTYAAPSDFSKPIVLDFEETALLTDFYRQCKYMTVWSHETQNEWLFVTDDADTALNGKNYIKLNGFNHYWNEAKFALYDPNHPENVLLLDKGAKYRVKMMVRCEDAYEVPVNMTMCLENPASRHLLAENGNVKLEYDPSGDTGGYMMFVGDIEVSTDMLYYPSLAVRRNRNDLQSLYIDTVSVEKLRDCTVKFEANGGTAFENAVVQIHDPVYDPGTPYRDGYVFEGWFSDSQFTKQWDFDQNTVENDMTLYAKWTVEAPEGQEPADNKPAENKPVEQEPVDNTPSGNNPTGNKPSGNTPQVVAPGAPGGDIQDPDANRGDVDNGMAPEFLEADAVPVKNNTEDLPKDGAGMPTWAIILICTGGGLIVLAAAAVTFIMLKRKTSENESN